MNHDQALGIVARISERWSNHTFDQRAVDDYLYVLERDTATTQRAAQALRDWPSDEPPLAGDLAAGMGRLLMAEGESGGVGDTTDFASIATEQAERIKASLKGGN